MQYFIFILYIIRYSHVFQMIYFGLSINFFIFYIINLLQIYIENTYCQQLIKYNYQGYVTQLINNRKQYNYQSRKKQRMLQNIKIQNDSFKKNEINALSTQGVPTFLSKTYEILQNSNYYDIISWTKNGQGFIVKKVKQFSQKILPLHFRHSNYSSFVRQLNMYDFHKMRQDNQENGFKNVLFRRGSKHLLRDIQRKDYKKNKQGKFQNKSGENNSSYRDCQNNRDRQLIKGLEEQLHDSIEFSKKSEKKYYKTLQTLNFELASLTNFEHQLEKMNSIFNPSTDLTSLIDNIFHLKKLNNQLIHQIEINSKQSQNYNSRKYNKWTLMIQNQNFSSDKNCIQTNQPSISLLPYKKNIEMNNIPTWASSNMSIVYNDVITNSGLAIS